MTSGGGALLAAGDRPDQCALAGRHQRDLAVHENAVLARGWETGGGGDGDRRGASRETTWHVQRRGDVVGDVLCCHYRFGCTFWVYESPETTTTLAGSSASKHSVPLDAALSRPPLLMVFCAVEENVKAIV